MKQNRFAHKLTHQQRRFIVYANAKGVGSGSLARALGVRRSTVRGHIRRGRRPASASA